MAQPPPKYIPEYLEYFLYLLNLRNTLNSLFLINCYLNKSCI